MNTNDCKPCVGEQLRDVFDQLTNVRSVLREIVDLNSNTTLRSLLERLEWLIKIDYDSIDYFKKEIEKIIDNYKGMYERNLKNLNYFIKETEKWKKT